MLSNAIILSTCIIVSCYSPIKVTKIADKYPEIRNSHKELVIHFSSDEIKFNYEVIANIKLENKVIYGNLLYDKRMKSYLLNTVNNLGADAIIFNSNTSDSINSFFDVIIYNSSLSPYEEVINFDEEYEK